jgi:hypothetical protein
MMPSDTVLSRCVETYTDLTFSASNTTASVTAFTLTGAVLVRQLWLEVTTDIGVNHTDGYFDSYDGAAAIDVSLGGAAAGITLSALKAGTVAIRDDVKTAQLALLDNANDIVSDVATKGTDPFTAFEWVDKTGATTTMRWTYTSTDTPTSGVARAHIVWEPLTTDGNVVGDGRVRPLSITPRRHQ